LRREASAESVLGPGGELERALSGYEHRPEQLELASAVESAFRDRRYLLAEAGTGTGKTLAYLVPAILSGRKVVVSTATKTLQDQIYFKDLPLLRERIGLEVKASYLKGRSNYLCLHRFEQFQADPVFDARDEAARWSQLKSWAAATETGDRSELDLPENTSTWRKLSTTSETCLGAKCPLYESCFVTRMRRKAEEADLLVVNHHLFFADLAIRSRQGAEGVLPKYDAVVFDEAHALEDAATSFFGSSVSTFRFDDLANDAQHAKADDDERAGMLTALALKAKGDGEAFFRDAQGVLPQLSREGSVRVARGGLDRTAVSLKSAVESLAALASYCAVAEEPEVIAIGRRASEIAADLGFVARAESVDHVYWAEARGRGMFLKAAPIEIADELRARLYEQIDTVVFASATLRADGRFEFFSRRVGLDRPVEGHEPPVELAVPSSFDYPRQAALYATKLMPEPNDPGFCEAAAEEIAALCEITGGRAFALFTSVRNMETVHGLLAHRLPYQVLLQGERPKQALLAAFRERPTVLFATQSFWEGVDVPGDALSLVVIDRLPFASPGDPLVAARIEQLKSRGEDAFGGYQLPQAAISLQQGFGRLIRTSEDRGIVAILDRRLITKPYGRTFVRSLPPAQRFSDRERLGQWFRAAGS
jgi:ATP-dependent DNA helicase DinG